jgi:hypothetical protein
MAAKAKAPRKPRKPDMSSLASTERDLAELAKRAPELATSGLAASALEMARGMDSGASLAQKTLAAKEHRETMAQLMALAPKAAKKDRMDDLATRRAKRLAG